MIKTHLYTLNTRQMIVSIHFRFSVERLVLRGIYDFLLPTVTTYQDRG